MLELRRGKEIEEENKMKNWNWEAIVEMMDDEIREQVHAELAPCTNAEFYARYCELAPDFDEQMHQTFSANMIAAAMEG